MIVSIIGALVGCVVSLYMLILSFTLIQNDSFKWYTINIFLACFIGNTTGVLLYLKQYIITGKDLIEKSTYEWSSIIRFWFMMHYRLVLFCCILELYLLYYKPHFYNFYLGSRKLLLHIMLQVISQLLCSPQTIHYLAPNAISEGVINIYFNITISLLFVACIITIILVIFQICKTRRSNPLHTYKKRLRSLLIYFIPMQAADIFVFIDAIATLLNKYFGNTKQITLFGTSCFTLSKIFSEFRCTLLAICTSFAFASYRHATAKLFSRKFWYPKKTKENMRVRIGKCDLQPAAKHAVPKAKQSSKAAVLSSTKIQRRATIPMKTITSRHCIVHTLKSAESLGIPKISQ